MAIRCNYDTSNSPRGQLNRKIDQHYEMASLAAADGDSADYSRHMALVEKYKQQLRKLGE